MLVSASAARCSERMPRVFSSMNRNSSRERREALAHAGARPVVGGQVPGRESRRHAQRCADVQGQGGRLRERRPLFARRVGELVPPQCAEVQTDIAQNAKGAVESLAGVALGEQGDDVRMTFVAQRRLDRISTADHLRRDPRCAKYRFSSSVFIWTKEVRIQPSNASALLLISHLVCALVYVVIALRARKAESAVQSAAKAMR